ncbi:hypothetical protein ACXJY6_10310 [Vibrio sp. RC27]
MFVTQSYIGSSDPRANIHIYYIFQAYDEQNEFSRNVQLELEKLGEMYEEKVALYMPNPRSANKIAGQILGVCLKLENSFPGLLITKDPIDQIEESSDDCIYIPFDSETAETAASIISQVRTLCWEQLSWDHSQPKKVVKMGVIARLGDAMEVKPGVFGIRLDLKKFFNKK